MREIDFIRNNYSELNKCSDKVINQFLLAYRKRVIRIYKDGELKGIAFYFKLNDDTLNKVKNREINLKDLRIANICLKETGDNIHFFSVIADNYITIIKGLRIIMNKKIKSVSWFSPDMKQFFIRRILCHQ